MDNVTIKNQQSREGQWEFEVAIGEDLYTVILDRDYYLKLSQEKVTPGQLVVSSIMFLLKREPKESILRKFHLKEINKYFPEYEKEIKIE